MTRRDAAGVTRTPLSLPPFPALFLSLYHSFRLSVPLHPSLFLSPSQLPLSLYSSRSFSPLSPSFSLSLSLSLHPARYSCIRLLLSPSLPLPLALSLTPSLLSLFPSFRLLLFPLPTHPSIALSLSLPYSLEILFSFPPTVIRSDLSRANEPDGSFYSWSTRSNENTALGDFFTLSLSSLPVDSSFAEDTTKPRFRGKRFALPISKHAKPIDRELMTD